jgi:thiamine-phosphate pyrophosphorylase
VLLYYITDRKQFPGPETERRERLLAKIAEAARAGVDYIQIREKDLPARELESLAGEAVRTVRETRGGKCETRLLINSRSDIALVTGADGVHLPSDDISAADARALWSSGLRNLKREMQTVIIAVSCHHRDQVSVSEAHGANFVVFGPVFEKRGTSQTVGLDGLRAVCQRVARGDKNHTVSFGNMPVLALGGVTLTNARACVAAGAAGIAAIRLFQENDVSSVVESLRQP